jgi:hypothetical protein
MSAFDNIDRKHRPVKIEREPPQEGDICSDPKCSGRLQRKLKHPDACHGLFGSDCYCLACNSCNRVAQKSAST